MTAVDVVVATATRTLDVACTDAPTTAAVDGVADTGEIEAHMRAALSGTANDPTSATRRIWRAVSGAVRTRRARSRRCGEPSLEKCPCVAMAQLLKTRNTPGSTNSQLAPNSDQTRHEFTVIVGRADSPSLVAGDEHIIRHPQMVQKHVGTVMGRGPPTQGHAQGGPPQ